MNKIILFFIIICSLKTIAQSEIQYIETVSEGFKNKYFEEKHDYNPLHVGDILQYNSSDNKSIVIVKDTLINAKKYFYKQHYNHPYFSSWERNDSTRNSTYRLDVDDLNKNGNNLDELLLDSLEVPNFSKYFSYRYLSAENLPDDSVNTLVEDSSWAIIFGDTLMTRTVQYLCCFTTQIIADKFGVVWSMTEGAPIILTGAIIDGITYGNIVSTYHEQYDLPSNYFLSNNYPNPFNPTTKIRYGIPEEKSVELSIYNMLGEKIEILVDEIHKAGNYEIEFNGTALGSGLYIYVLLTDEILISKKMLLIK